MSSGADRRTSILPTNEDANNIFKIITKLFRGSQHRTHRHCMYLKIGGKQYKLKLREMKPSVE